VLIIREFVTEPCCDKVTVRIGVDGLVGHPRLLASHILHQCLRQRKGCGQVIVHEINLHKLKNLAVPNSTRRHYYSYRNRAMKQQAIVEERTAAASGNCAVWCGCLFSYGAII